MRWIDVSNYIGWDRRLKQGLRFINRRKTAEACEPPSLATALRQLRVRSGALDTAEELGAFQNRVQALAQLAASAGRQDIADSLTDLADHFEAAVAAGELDRKLHNIEQL
ncbi:MAG: hypothetical protein WAU68_14920 [Vitreimonas sp.]